MKKCVLHLSVVCCLLSVVNSCKYSKEYQIVNAKNEFTISVPAWMEEETNLATGAPFQYANRFRNFYSVGFVTKKDTAGLSFDVLWNKNLLSLKNSLKNPLVTDSTYVEINGLEGVRAEVFGKMGGENIYFSEVMLEGKDKFYHLSVWVRGEERKLHFKEDINRIIGSVQEL